MILYIAGIRIRIHLFLPVLWVISAITGRWIAVFASLTSFLLHECGHIGASYLYRIPISEIEITPHGGLIRLDRMESLTPLSGFIIALAGPLSSLLGCILAWQLYTNNLSGYHFTQSFMQSNLLLLTINLFPALPLDGGRMLLAVLSCFFSKKKAEQILFALGYFLGFFLIAVSVYFSAQGELILAPAFAGIYIIYAAAIERKGTTERYITALIARRNKLDDRKILPIELLAVGKSMPLHRLLGKMKQGKYHMILILSEDGMQPIGRMNEKEFCDALLSNPFNCPIGNCIRKKRAHL